MNYDRVQTRNAIVVFVGRDSENHDKHIREETETRFYSQLPRLCNHPWEQSHV